MEKRSFDPGQFTDAVSDIVSIRRVYGEAYQRGDTLVIPVAKVMGGSGTGSGGGCGDSEAGGGGGCFATRVRATGVFVVDDEGVHWHPAFDLNRAVFVGQIVLGAAVITALGGLGLRQAVENFSVRRMLWRR
ncbi:MAG: hypothetical protein FWF02_03240 [Micrococcales bacterium]|nr:hypothetical protein [Micrococcales bacterium]MCL2666702.1 hypothetical protein [Micrococcales bacterium]